MKQPHWVVIVSAYQRSFSDARKRAGEDGAMKEEELHYAIKERLYCAHWKEILSGKTTPNALDRIEQGDSTKWH